ncbi:hypothetical protein BaRGS_00025416 [Batillaria attramentaria]|uniref:Uncharacterized protein n=1 Tax=Batillaria attramentaria TaxID=370345 RepID=A0ABD0K8C5_9CAEN
MPSTRSATVKSDDNTIEEIKKTKCPIQVNFKAGLNRVHYWRQVLYKRCADGFAMEVFYTSSTVRAQGFGYQVWIDEEFETLKTLADDLIASNPNMTLPTSNLAVPPSSTADEILTNNTGTVETDGSYHAPTGEETIRANSDTATGGTALGRETRATRKLGATEGISAKRDLGGEDASSGEVTDTGKTPVGQGAVRENDEAVNHTQALYSDAAPRATVTPASFAILADSAAHTTVTPASFAILADSAAHTTVTPASFAILADSAAHTTVTPASFAILADSAAHKLIFLMQQQLAESTTTISSLRIELRCGGTFTTKTGTFQSPGFPHGYPSNQDCVYVISRPEGERITLTFQHFDLEGGDGCPSDFVNVRDGNSPRSPSIVRVCNTSLPSPRRSFQNYMWIRFRSDETGNGTGFKASYTSAVEPSEFFLITSSEGKIYRMDVETLSNIVIPIPGVYNPIAVDYDPVEDRLYWTDVGIRQILSAHLDGSGVRIVRHFNRTAIPDGLAIDPLSRLVFYSDSGYDLIAMMSMSGSTHRTIISTDLTQPRAIVLDTMNGILFWTDWGQPEKIERANYDGSDRRVLHQYYLDTPNALAIDTDNQRLYWVDAGTDLVESSDLEGNDRRQLYSAQGSHFFGLAYYKDKLYATDWTKAGLMTSGKEVHRPNGCGSNNGGCRYFCIPSPGNTFKCMCPDAPTDCVIGTSLRPTTAAPTLSSRQVIITGPKPFDADGSRAMTLTCEPRGVKGAVTGMTWSVDYPPTAPPAIHGYKTGDFLEVGDSLTMTCLVRGGKPLVTSVIFSCPDHPDKQQDIRGDSYVQSLLLINSLTAEDDGMRCTCTAEWKQTDWYALSATRVLRVKRAAASNAASNQEGAAVGGAIGGVLIIIAVTLVVIFLIWRRSGRRKRGRPRRPRPSPEPEVSRYSEPGPSGFQGGQYPAAGMGASRWHEPHPSAYPTRPTIERNAPEHQQRPLPPKPDEFYLPLRARQSQVANEYDYLHPVEPADDYLHLVNPTDDYTHLVKPSQDANEYQHLHPVKPADDYLQPAKPNDDYLHPMKPADDYLHPVKPADDYLHPVKPADDYLHPVKPADDYLHPVKPNDD